MSALPHATSHALEPAIAGSSVPRCPCQRSQPCACERFARRLELRHREDVNLMREASDILRALAGVETAETTRRALLKLADRLF